MFQIGLTTLTQQLALSRLDQVYFRLMQQQEPRSVFLGKVWLALTLAVQTLNHFRSSSTIFTAMMEMVAQYFWKTQSMVPSMIMS